MNVSVVTNEGLLVNAVGFEKNGRRNSKTANKSKAAFFD